MLYGNVRRIRVNLVHQYNLNVSSIWLIGDESVRQILQKTLILYAYIYNKNNFGKPHEKQKYGKYAVYFIRQIFFCVFFHNCIKILSPTSLFIKICNYTRPQNINYT